MTKLSDKLNKLAIWLEDYENDILVSAEHNDDVLNIVAEAFIKAASIVKDAAEQIKETEAPLFTSEKLNEMAALAESFDESGDEFLQKQASVLDEILLTLAAPPSAIENAKLAQDQAIDELKKKYKQVKEKQNDMNKVGDSIKDIEKSPTYKTYRPAEAPLSTRTCPDHPGAPLQHTGESQWKCSMDGKQYSWENGFTTLQNNKVPGGSIDMQTKMDKEVGHTVFDTRGQRLGVDNGEAGK